MNFFKFIFVFSVFSLFSLSAFPQNIANSTNSEKSLGSAEKKLRIAKIKADILKDINALPIKDQTYYFSKLGNTLLEHEPKEALIWFAKADELKKKYPVIYKNNAEKLTALTNSISAVSESDSKTFNKLITEIKLIKIDESNIENLKSASENYILIANKIVSRNGDEKSALEFALLSLKGRKSAITSELLFYLSELQKRNETLANTYFNKLLISAKESDNLRLLIHSLFDVKLNYSPKTFRMQLSDSQIKDLLNFVFSEIQTETAALKLKQINDCPATKGYGIKFSDQFKRLLPEKLPIIENAVSACQNAEIEYWKKPDFSKRPKKTSQDILNLANEISDQKIKRNYLTLAAQTARYEKNYKLSLQILDRVDKEFRDQFWNWSKIEASSKLIGEKLEVDDFAGISVTLNSISPDLLPFVITKSLTNLKNLKPNQKDFVLNLLNQARAEFNKIKKFSNDISLNPSQYNKITEFYIEYKFYEQAIAAHQEAIIIYNRFAQNLPIEYKEKNIFPRTSGFSRFRNRYPQIGKEFIDTYFDQIYSNVCKFEYPQVRITEKLDLLDEQYEKPQNNILIPGIPSFVN